MTVEERKKDFEKRKMIAKEKQERFIKNFDKFLENENQQIISIKTEEYLLNKNENKINLPTDVIVKVPNEYGIVILYKTNYYGLNAIKSQLEPYAIYDQNNKKLYTQSEYYYDTKNNISNSSYFENTIYQLLENIKNELFSKLNKYIVENEKLLKENAKEIFKKIYVEQVAEKIDENMKEDLIKEDLSKLIEVTFKNNKNDCDNDAFSNFNKEAIQNYLFDKDDTNNETEEKKRLEYWLEKKLESSKLIMLYLIDSTNTINYVLNEYLNEQLETYNDDLKTISRKEKIGVNLIIKEYKKEIVKSLQSKDNQYTKTRDIVRATKNVEAQNLTITILYENKEYIFKYQKSQLVSKDDYRYIETPLFDLREYYTNTKKDRKIVEELRYEMSKNSKEDNVNFRDFIKKITYGRKVLYEEK